jgi:2-C-methyl-D-erythritol 4-phosphate cytidylyltransferase
MRRIAILLAGGKGSRLGAEIPKQFLRVQNRPVFSYALETVARHPLIDEIRVVADAEYRSMFPVADIDGFSDPGCTRQASVRNAVNDLAKKYEEYGERIEILVHDSARPLLTAELIDRVFAAMDGHEAVMPVLPVTDTVYVCNPDGTVASGLDRKRIFAGQAPEAFELWAYKAAMDRLSEEEFLAINGSSEPALLAGMDLVTVAGDPENFKITRIQDLERFAEIKRSGQYESLGTACAGRYPV